MSVIVGIDEVGRGCWAGPLVAAAVILNEPIDGLKDSKLLSAARREELALLINLQAASVGLGWVDAATIDRVGITTAVKWAMEQALEQIKAEYDEVIIDGQFNFLSDKPKTKAVVKADATLPAASAASIVAKVARDKYMVDMAGLYPNYGFDRHVGYGTALHLDRLKKHGISKLHRQSFKPIKALLADAANKISSEPEWQDELLAT
ncbi:MAG TPA: ribonuclease HII [Candidatus Saccharimonadales bacterium]|nr:ribonuclease HII [Candidatus Saccharimonadales bacterium]